MKHANNATTPLPDRSTATKHVAFPPKRDTYTFDVTRSVALLQRAQSTSPCAVGPSAVRAPRSPTRTALGQVTVSVNGAMR
jgi:hypothetical protein